MRHGNRNVKLSILPAILFVLLAGLYIQSGAARAEQSAITCNKTWHQISSPNAGSSELDGVTATSASDAWAVGYGTNSSFTSISLAEHWNGSAWSIVSTPNPSASNGTFLLAAAAVSTSDVWAVGDYLGSSSNEPLIENWNGSSWSIVTSPSLSNGGRLTGVTAISATNIWAVGFTLSSGSTATLIEHYNGKVWKIVASPNPSGQSAELFGVSAFGGKNIWAVGEQYNSSGITTTLTEHYNGSSWSIVSSPNVTSNPYTLLNGVTTISSSVAWAVGQSSNSSGAAQTVIEKWNGSSWSLVSSPSVGTQSFFLGVASASTSNIWTVGSSYNGGTSQTLAAHFNGSAWKVVSVPALSNSGLESISRVPATKYFWTVGFTLNGANSQTLTDYYC